MQLIWLNMQLGVTTWMPGTTAAAYSNDHTIQKIVCTNDLLPLMKLFKGHFCFLNPLSIKNKDKLATVIMAQTV